MNNKLKALLLTPCIIGTWAAAIYGAKYLLTSDHGSEIILSVIVLAGVGLVYGIVYNILEG